MYRARELDERNQKAVPRVARIVGITITSMIPVALSIISRSAAATGPFGSSTPSEQPPSAAAPTNKTASVRYRISDPLRFGRVGAVDAQRSVNGRDNCRSRARGERERPPFPAVASQQSREQHKQV